MAVLNSGGGWIATALLAAAFAAPPRPQDREEVSEYSAKAAFLLNFAKYVEWPPGAFPDDKAPFRIGIAGEDRFGDRLEKTFKDRTVNGRSFVFERYREAKEIKSCHLLFISRTDKDRTQAALAKAGKPGVLTVGEDGDFAKLGGIISILIEDGKPRLEVNPDAAEAQKLTISSKLLRVATIVRPEK